MISGPSLSIAPKLEFNGPGCHSLLRPLLLQNECCGWKISLRYLPKPKCFTIIELVRHGLKDVRHETEIRGLEHREIHIDS